jgi:zinc transport system substrate-binding protein
MGLAKKVLVLTTFLLLLTGWLTGCSENVEQDPRAGESKIRVVATIFPLADIARNIGGEKVEVTTLLPPGSSPHTFEATPEQVKQLAEARVFIKVGAGLDSFADKLAGSANPDMVTVTVTDNIELLSPLHEREEGHDHDHSGGDPHVWLDPVLVREQIAPKIAAVLGEVSPGNTQYFQDNLEAYDKKLDLLHREIEETTSKFRYRSFVAFHSSWRYFSRRYDLEDITVSEFPSKEPSALWIARVVDRSRTGQAKAVLIEPQASPKAAKVIAAELKVPVYTVDPLGAENIPGYGSYLDMMRSNLKVFERALR